MMDCHQKAVERFIGSHHLGCRIVCCLQVDPQAGESSRASTIQVGKPFQVDIPRSFVLLLSSILEDSQAPKEDLIRGEDMHGALVDK
jgi:hypothetical protein